MASSALGDKGSKLGNAELGEKQQKRRLKYLFPLSFTLCFAKPPQALAVFNAVLLLILLTLEINGPLEKQCSDSGDCHEQN